MTFNSDIHLRHSLRFAGYDYTSAGYYFITICLQNREFLLGEISTDEISVKWCGADG